MEVKRRTSIRTLLIYVLPAAMDLVSGLVLFVATVRASEMGGEALRAASVLTVWSLVYVTSCPVVGRFVKPGNAAGLVLGGILVLAVACGSLAYAAAYVPMLLLVAATALGAALFFPPFQIFMKDVGAADGRSLAASTGLYTFFWSAGYACGPLVSGLLMQRGASNGQGWRVSYLLGAGLCILLSVGFLLMRRAGSRSAVAAPVPPVSSDAPTGRRDFAWLGWIVAGVGLVGYSMIRSVFPARALNVLHLAEGNVGAILFVVSLSQALTGLAMTKSRAWMYRPLPLVAFSIAGLAGILCFGFASSLLLLLGGSVLFGVYTGFFYFFLVYHALVHPTKAGHYVALNESVVGIAGVAAPLAAGLAIDTLGSRSPYLAAGVLIVAVIVFQTWALRRRGG